MHFIMLGRIWSSSKKEADISLFRRNFGSPSPTNGIGSITKGMRRRDRIKGLLYHAVLGGDLFRLRTVGGNLWAVATSASCMNRKAAGYCQWCLDHHRGAKSHDLG